MLASLFLEMVLRIILQRTFWLPKSKDNVLIIVSSDAVRGHHHLVAAAKRWPLARAAAGQEGNGLDVGPQGTVQGP